MFISIYLLSVITEPFKCTEFLIARYLNSPSTQSLLDADIGSGILDTVRSSKRVDTMSNKSVLPQAVPSDLLEALFGLSIAAKRQAKRLFTVVILI